jgi:signal transduction histidine kinase
MPLLNRVIAVLLLAGAVCVGVYWVFAELLHSAHVDVAARRELRLLGRSVQTAVESALRDQQSQDISETFARIEWIDPELHVMVFDLKGQMTFHSEGTTTTDQAFSPMLARFIRENPDELFAFDDGVEPATVRYLLPLRHDHNGPVTSYLGLLWNLGEVQEDMEPMMRLSVGTVLAFVLFSLLLGGLYGRFFITRPLRALADALARARDGDFDVQLQPSRADEIGLLMEVFNAMGAQIRASHQQLQAELEERQVLQQALQRLDKLASIGQLAAGLAHEIGSPLQVVAGRARSLHRRAEDPAEVRRIADILVAQSERIACIVEQLLHFVRPRPTPLSPCRLRPCVSTVVDLLQVEARRAGVSLRLLPAATPDDPLVLASPDQIQQILFNLILNALIWTPRGGAVEVCCGRSDPSPPLTWALDVSDTGPGITPGLESQIFDPFITTRAAEGGSGLGLAVVKNIAAAHSGLAFARTRPEGGSVFSVRLPLYTPPEALPLPSDLLNDLIAPATAPAAPTDTTAPAPTTSAHTLNAPKTDPL